VSEIVVQVIQSPEIQVQVYLEDIPVTVTLPDSGVSVTIQDGIMAPPEIVEVSSSAAETAAFAAGAKIVVRSDLLGA
jgi:hypothetical protein